MKVLDNIFNNVVNVNKKGKSLIVTTSDNIYVLKEKNILTYDIYEYLSSRGFDNYPKIVIPNDKYNIYEYINEYKSVNEEKIIDFVNILSLLHSKTTYYKDMDIDEYKSLYEDLLSKINYTEDYYDKLLSSIESSSFMSPSSYLLARNISKIYSSLVYATDTLNSWYDLVKKETKKRVVLIYNNIDLNHLIKNKDIYLINWEKSTVDLPIYDIYNLYIKYSTKFDFIELLHIYESRYPLTDVEKKLLYVLISIPEIVFINKDEISNTKNIKVMIDLIYKNEVFIMEYDKIPD